MAKIVTNQQYLNINADTIELGKPTGSDVVIRGSERKVTINDDGIELVGYDDETRNIQKFDATTLPVAYDKTAENLYQQSFPSTYSVMNALKSFNTYPFSIITSDGNPATFTIRLGSDSDIITGPSINFIFNYDVDDSDNPFGSIETQYVAPTSINPLMTAHLRAGHTRSIDSFIAFDATDPGQIYWTEDTDFKQAENQFMGAISGSIFSIGGKTLDEWKALYGVAAGSMLVYDPTEDETDHDKLTYYRADIYSGTEYTDSISLLFYYKQVLGATYAGATSQGKNVQSLMRFMGRYSWPFVYDLDGTTLGSSLSELFTNIDRSSVDIMNINALYEIRNLSINPEITNMEWFCNNHHNLRAINVAGGDIGSIDTSKCYNFSYAFTKLWNIDPWTIYSTFKMNTWTIDKTNELSQAYNILNDVGRLLWYLSATPLTAGNLRYDTFASHDHSSDTMDFSLMDEIPGSECSWSYFMFNGTVVIPQFTVKKGNSTALANNFFYSLFKSINLTAFTTDEATSLNRTLSRCPFLETVDISNWNLDNVTDWSNFLESLSSMTTLKIKAKYCPTFMNVHGSEFESMTIGNTSTSVSGENLAVGYNGITVSPVSYQFKRRTSQQADNKLYEPVNTPSARTNYTLRSFTKESDEVVSFVIDSHMS